MNWILLLAIILIVGGTIVGWKTGFVKIVFSLVSTIVVIILTIMFSPIVVNVLKSSEMITTTVQNGLGSVVDLSGVLNLEEEVQPESFIDNLKVPDSMKEILTQAISNVFSENNASLEEYREEKLAVIENYICSLLTNIILNAIGFFITFVIASIAVAILCFVLNIISKLPVLHQINVLAGASVGAVEGLMLVWIGFIIITMLGSTEFGQNALELISESTLLSVLYDNNVLAKFIF